MENNVQDDTYQKPKPNKTGRKPKVKPEGDVIEKVVPREEVVQEVSYSAGKKLKEKKPMSEKQQANIHKLIALNVERKKQRDEEKKMKVEREEKQRNEVKVVTKIRAKRPYVRKEEVKRLPKKDFKNYDPYEDDESEEQETTDGGNTTGDEVKKVRKYAKRIEKINKVLAAVPEKPAVKKSDYGDLMRVLF